MPLAERLLGPPRESASGTPSLLLVFLVATAVIVGAIVLLAVGTWWGLGVALALLVLGAAAIISDIDRYTDPAVQDDD